MEHLKEFFSSFIPFILQAGQHPKINKARLLESIIIAAVIGGMIYGTFKAEMVSIKDSLTDIRQDVRTLSNRIDFLTDKRR